MIRPALHKPKPKTKPSLRLGLIFCLALPATAVAQGVQRDPLRPDQASSWKTTTHVLSPPAKKIVSPVATSSLPAASAAKPATPVTGQSHTLRGIASYYWQEQKTSTGEMFDKMAMTAAHKTLPFGTRVRVTNLENGRSVVVRINDRGPFKAGRVIDLSYAAADIIDMRKKGLAPVKIDVVK